MRSKSFCSQGKSMLATERVTNRQTLLVFFWVAAWVMTIVPQAAASGDAPQWMHALVGVTLPSYDEKTDAVVLYSETNVTVLSENKIRTRVRNAYKILRPDGRERGTVAVYFNPNRKITSLHAWCIPAQGKDFEVKDKDAMDFAAPAEGGYLVEDTRYRILHVPAPDPGNIIGYEYEVEEQPFWLQYVWYFQGTESLKENSYSLELPSGWEYKVSWLNHGELKPAQAGANVWQWAVSDVKGVREQPEMPPSSGIVGQMIVSFFPPGGTSRKNELANWKEMGKWYWNL